MNGKTTVMKGKLILIFFISVMLTNCNKPEIDIDYNDSYGVEYFPLRIGDTLTYKITTINIDRPTKVFDTTVYYLKEVIESKFIDNENDTAYRIERYISPDNNYWKIHQVWSAKITDKYAVKVEENNRIIKLRFPIAKDNKWNGNLLNSIEDKTFKISNLYHKFNTSTYYFDNCLTVLQDSLESIINKDYECEIYHFGIGLIYKEVTHISSQVANQLIKIEDRATTSSVFIQELIAK